MRCIFKLNFNITLTSIYKELNKISWKTFKLRINVNFYSRPLGYSYVHFKSFKYFCSMCKLVRIKYVAYRSACNHIEINFDNWVEFVTGVLEGSERLEGGPWPVTGEAQHHQGAVAQQVSVAAPVHGHRRELPAAGGVGTPRVTAHRALAGPGGRIRT